MCQVVLKLKRNQNQISFDFDSVLISMSVVYFVQMHFTVLRQAESFSRGATNLSSMNNIRFISGHSPSVDSEPEVQFVGGRRGLPCSFLMESNCLRLGQSNLIVLHHGNSKQDVVFWDSFRCLSRGFYVQPSEAHTVHFDLSQPRRQPTGSGILGGCRCFARNFLVDTNCLTVMQWE